MRLDAMNTGNFQMATMAEKKARFIEIAKNEGLGSNGEITRQEVMSVKLRYNLPYPSWLCADPDRKIRHGVYSCPELNMNKTNFNAPPVGSVIEVAVSPETQKENNMSSLDTGSVTEMNLVRAVDTIANEIEKDALIPAKCPLYVRHGNHGDIEKIIGTRQFLPIWVTGLSGNGKTFMIEQVCAKLRREFIRVNITNLTDEDDLIGGFRLVNGETVWQDGPVTLAMKRGAILLLDECDLGTEKIMCLQPILEGNGIFIKKINTFVPPADGFNIVATANTKGQGGENSDRFIGTNIMNEAFMERFALTLEQDYPTKAIEKKILLNLMNNLNCNDEQFADNLVSWADGIRRTFNAGGINDIITTRRLAQIIRLYSIFQDRKKAISHATARFNAESREAFINLYDKVDATPEPVQESETSNNDDTSKYFGNLTEEQLKHLADNIKAGRLDISKEDIEKVEKVVADVNQLNVDF